MTKPQHPKKQSCFDPIAHEMEIFCNSQLDDYFAGVKGELDQVEKLIGDATGDLIASLKCISKLSCSQLEISMSIARLAAGDQRGDEGESVGHLLMRQKAIVVQIEQEVNAAVTSMQFGDLVVQLLDHVMIRIEALGTALQRVDTQDMTAGGDTVYKPHRFHEGVAKAVTAANTVTLETPVKQRDMSAGDIDLF
jgi:hypothetical protein